MKFTKRKNGQNMTTVKLAFNLNLNHINNIIHNLELTTEELSRLTKGDVESMVKEAILKAVLDECFFNRVEDKSEDDTEFNNIASRTECWNHLNKLFKQE